MRARHDTRHDPWNGQELRVQNQTQVELQNPSWALLGARNSGESLEGRARNREFRVIVVIVWYSAAFGHNLSLSIVSTLHFPNTPATTSPKTGLGCARSSDRIWRNR